MQEDLPDATNWKKVVAIMQEEFHDGAVVEEWTWQTVLLIPRGKRDFMGVGLVEFLWGAVASLLN